MQGYSDGDNSFDFGQFEPTQDTRLGRMLVGGRLTTTMLSKKSGQHLTLTLHCMKKGQQWEHVSYPEATHVFIKMGHGEYGSQTIGTYYPKTGKLYWKSNDKAWRFAAVHALLAAKIGQQEHMCFSLREEERCGRCGRALTDPVSIARGLGPECYGQLTGSVHYTHVEENLVEATQERVREVSQRPSPIPGNRPITTEKVYENGSLVAVSQHGGTNYDKKGREVPRTFSALAASVKR